MTFLGELHLLSGWIWYGWVGVCLFWLPLILGGLILRVYQPGRRILRRLWWGMAASLVIFRQIGDWGYQYNNWRFQQEQGRLIGLSLSDVKSSVPGNCQLLRENATWALRCVQFGIAHYFIETEDRIYLYFGEKGRVVRAEWYSPEVS